MKFESKRQLIEQIDNEWNRLHQVLAEVGKLDLTEVACWGDGWTAKDMLMHLCEWHGMLLRWYRVGLRGAMPTMPAKGYSWSQTIELNRAIYQKHKHVSWPNALRRVKASHARVLNLVTSLSQSQLLRPGQYAWCGKSKPLPLASYVHPNTSGHYRWAQKHLKRLLAQARRP